MVGEEKYQFYDPKLVDTVYKYGDAYDDNTLNAYRKSNFEWNINQTMPGYDQSYLKYVKDLSSNGWPHLRILADFMEVTTDPRRWQSVKYEPNERKQRSEKTKIFRLDYHKHQVNPQVTVKPFNRSCELTTGVQDDGTDVELRLYVVEDLSRDVIECLGKSYDVEPDFFRDHILDFAWYNVRDFWRNPPSLAEESRHRKWTQIRFVTARYFESSGLFRQATEEARGWNVFRRPDDDSNDKVSFDKESSIVSLTRTRASFWHRRGGLRGEKAIGILLLDPTLKNGFPLWRGRRNWETPPGIRGQITPAEGEERPNGKMDFFDDFVCWAKRPSLLPYPLPENRQVAQTSNVHVPIQVILHLICSEWLTLGDYIKTRLNQIEWEIAFPENFIKSESQIDDALKRLHMWRRFVPLYREMLSETLERVFHLPCHDEAPLEGSCPCITKHAFPPSLPLNPYNATSTYRHDFVLALSFMTEYQERIDRLTSVITAVISIKDSHRALEDSKRAQTDNKNIGRLSWLATFFLPYSVIASIFAASAVKDMTAEWIRLYFEVAAPLAVVTILLAYVLTLPQVHREVHYFLVKLGVMWALRSWHLLPEEESS